MYPLTEMWRKYEPIMKRILSGVLTRKRLRGCRERPA
jgi:hypothetical protein